MSGDGGDCAALVLVPTRELALQTSQVCKELGKHLNIQVRLPTARHTAPAAQRRKHGGVDCILRRRLSQ